MPILEAKTRKLTARWSYEHKESQGASRKKIVYFCKEKLLGTLLPKIMKKDEKLTPTSVLLTWIGGMIFLNLFLRMCGSEYLLRKLSIEVDTQTFFF